MAVDLYTPKFIKFMMYHVMLGVFGYEGSTFRDSDHEDTIVLSCPIGGYKGIDCSTGNGGYN